MIISLPEPKHESTVALEQSLAGRRSIRNFHADPLALQDVSQLLWAAQGITSPRGFRTAPSAGALYPLKIYGVVGSVEKLEPGVYQYIPEGHNILRTAGTDVRAGLTRAALGQHSIQRSPFSLVMTAVYERTTSKYGQRGIRYVHMDAGHAAQNICLQAYALHLGTVPIGAFEDEAVRSILQLADNEIPLYILPVGKH